MGRRKLYPEEIRLSDWQQGYDWAKNCLNYPDVDRLRRRLNRKFPHLQYEDDQPPFLAGVYYFLEEAPSGWWFR